MTSSTPPTVPATICAVCAARGAADWGKIETEGSGNDSEVVIAPVYEADDVASEVPGIRDGSADGVGETNGRVLAPESRQMNMFKP